MKYFSKLFLPKFHVVIKTYELAYKNTDEKMPNNP